MDWCWSWSSNTLATWCKQPAHWKRPWCWEILKAKGEEGDRGWDGWKAPPIQRTWTWANSRREWRTGKPMGSQRVWHNLPNEQQQENWFTAFTYTQKLVFLDYLKNRYLKHKNIWWLAQVPMETWWQNWNQSSGLPSVCLVLMPPGYGLLGEKTGRTCSCWLRSGTQG